MKPHGTIYTPAEDETIRTMFSAGCTDADIADALDRSTSSVRSRREKMRVTRKFVPLNEEDNATIARMFAAGHTDAEIGLVINRSEYSVGSRRRRGLGLYRSRERENPARGLPAETFEAFNDERPVGEPFLTRSGEVGFVHPRYGLVAYSPWLYGTPSSSLPGLPPPG